MDENTMKRALVALGAAWGLTMVVGGGALWAQSAQVGALTERVDALSLDTPDGFAADDGSSDDLVSMRRRLRALEGKVGRIGGGGSTSLAVEVQPGSAAGTPGAPAVTAVSVRPDAVVAALESEDPEVQERVRAALRREVDALREERRDERRERREERAEKAVDDFAEKANLSSMQAEELKTLLESERAQIRDVFQTARRDGDFESIRTKLTEIRAQTDAEAIPGLDEGQADAYEKMREEEVERFTGGRGRGGRRGGGGGGGGGGGRR